MKKTSIILLLIIQSIVLSCVKGKDNLELRILNSELYSYATDLNLPSIGQISLIRVKKVQKLEYSITNLSNRNIIFIPNSDLESLLRARFESKKNFDLHNLLIKDSVNSRLEIGVEQISFTDDYIDKLRINSHSKQFYKNLGYNEKFASINEHLLNHYTIIPKKSTVYFENWLFLPFENVEVDKTPFYSYLLLKNNKYELSLIMQADTTEINKYLTKSQLKTIKENNYKLYHGTLESVNSVPIKFIE